MTGGDGSGRRDGARRGGAAVVLALCSLVATVSAGCTSARNTLGTNASPCFEALAIGEDAVHGRGSFAGVRPVSLTALGADVHLRAELSRRFGTRVHGVCVVSYKGTFTVDQVERPLGPAPPGGLGHYAIVIVSEPQNELVGTVVRLTQPLRFGHPI
ncbi:MAG TPA: hypothetical protein VN791_00360 [Acidimicrobiales bacterium]|nr:hypothetical protein [Acidimicrobiales bacterium]